MNVECRAFCSVMVTSVKEWLSGIWNHSLVFSTIVVPSEQHSTQRQVLMNFYEIVHCRAEATRVRSYSHSCINDSLACMHMYVKEDIFLVNSHKRLIESRIDTFEAVITKTIHSRCYHQVPLITNDTLSLNFLSNEALSSYIEMTSWWRQRGLL